MATRFALKGEFGSVSAAKDVLRISGPDLGVCRIIEIHVTNEADETSEMLPFNIAYSSTNDGTGTAATPHNLEFGRNALISAGAYAGLSAVYNLSSDVTGTTEVMREAVNILSGFHFVPVPESRPSLVNNDRLVVRLDAAPTNTLTLAVYAVIEVE